MAKIAKWGKEGASIPDEIGSPPRHEFTESRQSQHEK